MSQETVPAFEGYADFLSDIKGRIQTAQVRAALSLSREVVWRYWQIGDEVWQRQARHGWGAKVVDRLAADLKASFPGVTGFSRTNLLYMRAFAEAYPTRQSSNSCWTIRRCPGGTTSGSWTG